LIFRIGADGRWELNATSDDYKILQSQGHVPPPDHWQLIPYEEFPKPLPGPRPYDPPSAAQD